MSCVILMYHVVDEPRSASEARFCCPPHQFRAQMKHLADAGWCVITLSELVACIQRGEAPPERSVVITFDDGTACTREIAMPILDEFGFKATVYVVSELIDGVNDWMIKEGQPERKMITVSQLRELDEAGMEIGSHTAHHVWMAKIPEAQAAEEASNSKVRLEDLLGKPVNHFAYPYGNNNSVVREIVEKAGYISAVSTRAGKNNPETGLFSLRRIEIMGNDALWQFRLKLKTGTHDMPPWSLMRAKVKACLGMGRRGQD